MQNNHLRWWPIGALLFVLAACGPANQASTPTVAPTTAYTAVPAPTTAAYTAEPTAAPVPTTEPTAAPAATTEAPTANTALPNDASWVLAGGALNGDDEQLKLEEHGLPVPTGDIQSSPGGAFIAYLEQDGKLVVVDMRSFTRILAGNELEGLVVGFSFAPDGHSLALTLLNEPVWSLQVRDLAAGTTREVQKGSSAVTSPNDPLPLIPRPMAWTTAGLFTTHILWATDAPPRNVSLVNSDDGSEQMIYEGDFLGAVPAPNGTQVAIITGQPGMGAVPTMNVAVVSAAESGEQVLVPERQGYVRRLRWSPDGSHVLIASSSDYSVNEVMLQSFKANGLDEQSIMVGDSHTPGSYADIAWQDDQTVLLLMAKDDGYIHLSALSLSTFSADALQAHAAYQGQLSPSTNALIVYTPTQ